MAVPLPYRPLEVRGHGVYDPETGNFYPFTTASTTNGVMVTGRKYWYLYVYCVIVSGQNSGDRGAGYSEVLAGSISLARIDLGATSAAAATSSAMAIVAYPNVLIPPDINITFYNGAAEGKAVVIYAAIPDDGGGK